MSTFTLPSQVLTINDKPKEEKEVEIKPKEEKEEIPMYANMHIVIAGNLSETMADMLNKELKIKDGVVEKTTEVSTATESLAPEHYKKIFVYANTTTNLESQSLPVSLDVANITKHFKNLGYECFVILQTDEMPKTFRNSTALENHIQKINVPTFVSYNKGISSVLKYLKGK